MVAPRQLIRRALGAALPRSHFLLSGPSDRRDVALTFDDGPDPERTPRLLDALAEANIVATFFVVGARAERHPALVARAAREGHAIGHHSWTHSEPSRTSAATLAAEVRRSVALLRDITGRIPDRFRPPKGELTATKCTALWAARQRIILWSADPRDYQLPSGEALAEWARHHRPANGEVVLLHDIHPHAANALGAFAAWRDSGVRFVTVDAWLPAERLA